MARVQFVNNENGIPTPARELVETDQLALVAMTRGDFGCYIPTASPWGPVGLIYDIRRS